MAVQKIPKKKVTLIEPKNSYVVDKEKHHQKRVAAYCRVSTDSEEQLTSYKNQVKTYTEMIAANKEWELAGIYADEGITGTQAKARPHFTEMINHCLAGKIDYIITKSVSRFARNTVECIEYVRLLKSRGIGVIFEEHNIDTLKSDSELLLTLLSGLAQSESESISKNVTWTFHKKFEEGKPIFVYKKLLGYRKGLDGEPEIVPEEAEVVRRIFDMFLAGATIDSISKTIRNEGIQFPPKNLSFSRNMIFGVLRNEKYCGDCILQKTVTVSCIEKIRKKNDGSDAPMWLVENNHPPIISREMFNRTQEELARRGALTPMSQKNSVTKTGKYSKYALSEVLICGECGSRYKRVTWTNHGKKHIVWRCINRLDHGKTYCPHSISVDEIDLQNAIVRALKRFNAEDESIYLSLMKATIAEAIGLNGGSDEIDLLEKRIDILNRRVVSLAGEYMKAGEDIETHEDEFKEISDEIEQLKARIRAIQEALLQNDQYEERLNQLQSTIENRQQNADVYDDSIVRQMIECIRVFADGHLEIIFGGGYEIEESLLPEEK